MRFICKNEICYSLLPHPRCRVGSCPLGQGCYSLFPNPRINPKNLLRTSSHVNTMLTPPKHIAFMTEAEIMNTVKETLALLNKNPETLTPYEARALCDNRAVFSSFITEMDVRLDRLYKYLVEDELPF